MTILPIKLISETDQPLFGANIYNLSKLERLNFPVLKGISVYPPEIILKTILEHFSSIEKDVYQQRLEIVKKEIAKIIIPAGLDKELDGLMDKKRGFFLGGLWFGNKNQAWQGLLQIWLSQIHSYIFREGLGSGVNSSLKAQTIFISPKKFSSITAYFDPGLEDVVIKAGQRLEPKVLKEIDQMVLEANKKLALPQIYQLILTDNKVFLVGLSPYTHTLPLSREEDIVLPKNEQKRIIKSAVKVFLDLSQGFVLEKNIDGVLIEGEKVKGWGNKLEWFDNCAFKLAESSLGFPLNPVIFRLPDIKDGQVRGTLRLLNQQSILKEAVDVFLFVRNKKGLLNLELAFPLTRTSDELSQIKRELACRGINRKGSLKFWLEAGVPENFINIEEYLEIGIDGIILNLDEIQKNLGGYEVHEGEFYQKQVKALMKFLTPAFKILHRTHIPVLVTGGLSLHHELLDFLIEAGIWGVVANTPLEADNLPEYLSWSEKRMVLKRLT